jgi:hypothetical protein
MKITKEQIKETLKLVMNEEADYKVFFKKALEKAGKSIPSMSDDEKKAFFNKIDTAWDAKGEVKEGNAFGAAVVAAKEAGEDEFEVDGEKFKVEESKKLSTDVSKALNVLNNLAAALFDKKDKRNVPIGKAINTIERTISTREIMNLEESIIKEGNIKLSSSAKKFWNTPLKKLFGGGYNLYDNIPPSQWNTHPEVIDGFGKNAAVDIFKGFIRDNINGKGYLNSKIAKMIGLPTNVSIIDYLNDGGSGLNGNKNFKKFNNWFSALYDIYEEMEKKFGKVKAESVNEVNESHSDCGCGCGGVTEGGCSTNLPIELSKNLTFEINTFLERPVLSKNNNKITVENSELSNLIPTLVNNKIHKRLSSGVKKEFIELLKKYK